MPTPELPVFLYTLPLLHLSLHRTQKRFFLVLEGPKQPRCLSTGEGP